MLERILRVSIRSQRRRLSSYLTVPTFQIDCGRARLQEFVQADDIRWSARYHAGSGFSGQLADHIAASHWTNAVMRSVSGHWRDLHWLAAEEAFKRGSDTGNFQDKIYLNKYIMVRTETKRKHADETSFLESNMLACHVWSAN